SGPVRLMIEDAKGAINRTAELMLFYRLVKEVGGAQVANSFFRFFALVSADNDYRDMLGLGGHAQTFQDLKSRAAGHIDIQQNHIGFCPESPHPRLQSIRSGGYFESFAQIGSQ